MTEYSNFQTINPDIQTPIIDNQPIYTATNNQQTIYKVPVDYSIYVISFFVIFLCSGTFSVLIWYGAKNNDKSSLFVGLGSLIIFLISAIILGLLTSIYSIISIEPLQEVVTIKKKIYFTVKQK